MTDAETEWLTRIVEILDSDNPLAAAQACLRQMSHEIVVLKQSGDHYQRQHGEALRLLEVARRRATYLTRQINDLGVEP